MSSATAAELAAENAALRARIAQLEAELAQPAAEPPAYPPDAQILRLTQYAVDRAGPGIFWIRPDGTIYYVNRAGCDLLGYSLQELLSLSFSTLKAPDDRTDDRTEDRTKDRTKDRTEDRTEDRPGWDDHWQDLRRRGLMRFETTLRRRDGRLVPVEIVANHLTFDGQEYDCAYVRDIGDRQRAAAALATSEARLTALIENTDGSIWSIDRDYRLVTANSIFHADMHTWLGWTFSPGDFVLPDEFPPALIAQWRSWYDRALAGEHFLVESESLRNNVERVCERAFNPIRDSAGAVTGVVIFSRDVTERVTAARERFERERRFRSLFNHSADIMFLVHVEPDGRFLYEEANPAMARAVRQGDAAISGKSPHDLIPPRDADRIEARYRDCLQRRTSITFEETVERASDPAGTRRTWRTQLIPIPNAAGAIDVIAGISVDITDLKQKEAALRASAQRFRTMLDEAPIGIALVREERILYVNPVQARLFGFDQPAALAGTAFIDLVAPEERETLRMRQRAAEADAPAAPAFDTIGLRADGSVFPMAAAANQIQLEDGPATLFFVQDMTSQKRAFDALIAAERRFHNLLDTMQLLAVVLDPQGIITYANEYTLRLLGYDRHEFLGQSWFDFCLPAEVRDQMWSAYQEGMEQGALAPHIVNRIKIRNGATRTIAWNNTVLLGPDRSTIGSAGIGDDITDRLAAETELRRLNETLEDRVLQRTGQLQREIADRQRAEEALRQRSAALELANQELEKAARLKDQFLGIVSHELRTPLTGILGLAELIQREYYGPLTPKQLLALERILDSGRHLRALINDILDLTRIEAGALTIAPRLCSAHEIGQTCLQMIKPHAESKHQRIRFIMPNRDLELWADPLRLKQILINLLSNAVKFTPANGHITLRIEGGSAVGAVRFIVEDTGIGIAAGDIPKLFAPFTQLDTRLAREYEGAGLGLALVQRLAHLHQGAVEVQSELGAGSCFTVTLPWLPAPAGEVPALKPAGPPAPARKAATTTPSAATPLILLVDDSRMGVDPYYDMLAGAGYRVMQVTGGEEGLRAAVELVPALILMDIQMPGMDGLEAIRRIRASSRPEVAAIPIVALTALAMAGDREHCLAAGADDYLSKPADMQVLLDTVQAFLRR